MQGRLSRILVLPLLLAMLLASRAGAEEEGGWSFHSELDLFLGLKAGAEYRFPGDWGVLGSLGFCLISPLQASWTLVGVWHLSRPDAPFQLGLEFGVIQSVFNVFEPLVDLDPAIDWASFYLVPGACVQAGLRDRGGRVYSCRLGAGLLLGWDMGAWQAPSFMPNLAFSVDFPLRRRR